MCGISYTFFQSKDYYNCHFFYLILKRSLVLNFPPKTIRVNDRLEAEIDVKTGECYHKIEETLPFYPN